MTELTWRQQCGMFIVPHHDVGVLHYHNHDYNLGDRHCLYKIEVNPQRTPPTPAREMRMQWGEIVSVPADPGTTVEYAWLGMAELVADDGSRWLVGNIGGADLNGFRAFQLTGRADGRVFRWDRTAPFGRQVIELPVQLEIPAEA